MAKRIIDQHYVPQSYLKAWETRVTSIKAPTKKFDGINCFFNRNLEKGDGRNRDSVLCDRHTYTIGFKHYFVLPYIPEASAEYSGKIQSILEEQNAVAYYEGKLLSTPNMLIDSLNTLDEWEFFKADDISKLAKKKAIVCNIKEVRSYVLEKALDKHMDTKWLEILSRFIGEIESMVPNSEREVNITLNRETVSDVVRIMLLLMCRNPNFDCLGTFTGVHIALLKALFSLDIVEDDIPQIAESTNDLMHGAWLTQIYKGIVNNDKGFARCF